MPKQDSMGTETLKQPPVVLPFPLRHGYVAQVVVPRDLTKVEADRLCSFVQSLVVPLVLEG